MPRGGFDMAQSCACESVPAPGSLVFSFDADQRMPNQWRVNLTAPWIDWLSLGTGEPCDILQNHTDALQ
jgi:hypothetical protein